MALCGSLAGAALTAHALALSLTDLPSDLIASPNKSLLQPPRPSLDGSAAAWILGFASSIRQAQWWHRLIRIGNTFPSLFLVLPFGVEPGRERTDRAQALHSQHGKDLPEIRTGSGRRQMSVQELTDTASALGADNKGLLAMCWLNSSLLK